MSFRYELAGKDHSTEKAQDLGTWQNNLYCFICLTFTLSLKLFLTLYSSWRIGVTIDRDVFIVSTVVCTPAVTGTKGETFFSTAAMQIVQPNLSSSRSVQVSTKQSTVSVCTAMHISNHYFTKWYVRFETLQVNCRY